MIVTSRLDGEQTQRLQKSLAKHFTKVKEVHQGKKSYAFQTVKLKQNCGYLRFFKFIRFLTAARDHLHFQTADVIRDMRAVRKKF